MGPGKKVTYYIVEIGYIMLLRDGAREKLDCCDMSLPLGLYRESCDYSEVERSARSL